MNDNQDKDKDQDSLLRMFEEAPSSREARGENKPEGLNDRELVTDNQAPSRPVQKDPILKASWDSEGDTEWVRIRFQDNERRGRIVSLTHFFSELHRALIALTGDRTWSLRYASQIRSENFPFLHSSQSLRILFDPLGPYRDPTRELVRDGYLIWQIVPSQAYYFKSFQEASLIRDRERMIRDSAQEARRMTKRKKRFSDDRDPAGTTQQGEHNEFGNSSESFPGAAGEDQSGS